MKGLTAIAPVIVLAMGGVFLNAQQPASPAPNRESFYSVEKEAALGRQLAGELQKRVHVIDNPVLQNFTETIGQTIASKMPHARHPFRFSLIAEDPCQTTHEPAALPGGYVFVPAALFINAQNEEEFAGMLAHAMEHAAQQHGVRQTQQGTIPNLATIPLIFMGGWAGNCAQAAVPLGFIETQRDLEFDADLWAVRTMAAAGFDPQALLRYIERVQLPSPAATQKFRPLPERDQRLDAIRAAIKQTQPDSGRTAPRTDFAAAQDEVHRLLTAPPIAEPNKPPTLRRK